MDPLQLKNCLRLYPHDDNQGGFFVAVFEKLVADDSGIIEDDGMTQDAWNNPNIRQKPILDELGEFSKWFEEEYKRHCDEKGIPEEQRQKLGLIDQVNAAKFKEQVENDALGIPCGSLSQAKAEKQEQEELEKFPYVNLIKVKPDLWFNILSFFGIDYTFPADYLYRYQVASAKNIVLLNKGLHELMSAKKKFKLSVVNLGLKMFQKNRENKSEGQYRLLQEGLEVLLPYMDERRQIRLPDGDFFRALVEPTDNMLNFEKVEAKFGPEVRAKFTDIPKGSAVLRFPSANGEM